MKVLLAVDSSPCSEAATDAVLTQFRPEETEVLVLHVDEWARHISTELAFAEGANAADDVLEQRARIRREGQTLMHRSAQRLRAARFTASTEMRSGDAPQAILECADAWRPDVIVLGSHARRGVDRLLCGSVSETVLRHAACSVEVIRVRADSKPVDAHLTTP